MASRKKTFQNGLLILAVSFLLQTCAHLDRNPAALDVVRAYSRDLGGGASMILVGQNASDPEERFEVSKNRRSEIIQRDGKPNKPVAINPAEFGFEAPKEAWITPKYLLTRGSRMGPQKIFVFEGRQERTKYKFYGNKQEISIDTFKDADLPPELIEVGAARGQLFRATLAELAMSMVTYTPLIPLSVLWRHKHREILDWSRYHATYWENWINQALDNPGTMPEFEKVFSRDDLINIGFALSIRFNRSWTLNLFGSERWEGILTSENSKNKVDLFNVYRGLKKGDTEQNIGQMVKVANEQGLILVPFGPNIAVLFYDRNDLAPKEHWRSLNIDSKSPAEIEEARQKSQITKGSLVPIGIYVLSSSTGPLQLTDISDPLKIGLRAKVYKSYKLARDMGYAFYLSGLMSTGLRVTEAGVRWVFRKSGRPWFDYHISNYAELDVLLDSGLVTFDAEQVAVDSFCADLQSWGASEERASQLCSEIQNSKADPERMNRAIQSAMREMSDAEKKTGEWLFAARSRMEPQRTLSSMQFMNWFDSERRIRKLKEKTQKKDAARLLAEKNRALEELTEKKKTNAEEPVGVFPPKSGEPDRRLILFMVDGLARGELEEALKKYELPNLKALFVDAGKKFNVFTPRSISMPSWGTILTGYDPDEHGLRSNAVVSKIEFKPELLTDARKDLLMPEYIKEGRSHRKIMESGVAWLPRALPRDQVLLNFAPINDGAYPPMASLMKQFFTDFKEAMFGTFENVNALDLASAEATAREIEANPGKFKLVLNWYATIDAHTHKSSATKFRAYKVVDQAVGRVIAAAKRDPELRDAAVVLVSDHGSVGGLDPKFIDRPFTSGEGYVNDTAFNLTKFFAGDFEKNRDLRFVVAAAESPEPLFDFKFIKEFLIHPFTYTYRGAQKNEGEKNILVDYSGDRLAQIFMRKGMVFDLGDRMSLAELNNYQSAEWGAKEKFSVNLPERLLNLSFENLESTDPLVVKKIKTETGGRPVQFFAMALAGIVARESVEFLVANGQEPEDGGDRSPVLICAHPWRCGLIQTQRSHGQDFFRYFVVKNFSQNRDGRVSGQLSMDPADDPISYLGKVFTSDESAKWRNDQEWLRLAEKTENPTILFGLVKALSNAPRLSGNVIRQAELPDFILTANMGFNFNSSRMTEGDHGAFSLAESQITFVVSGLGKNQTRAQDFPDPRLARDAGATLFDLLGFKDTATTQGESLLGRSSSTSP